jgi:hypothetical protein
LISRFGLRIQTLTRWNRSLDASWPELNKDAEGEDYANLLSELRIFGIDTIGTLRKAILKWRRDVLVEEASRLKDEQAFVAAGDVSPHIRTARVNAGVFFTHVGLTRLVLEREEL